jgi:hypothetical protein
MNPVIIHADGTDCRHEGNPQATMRDDGGPLCPAGQPVTHIRLNGHVLTIEQAGAAFRQMTDAFAKAVKPLRAFFSGLGQGAR